MVKSIRVNVKGKWYTVEVGDVHRNPIEVIVDGERHFVDVETGVPTTSPTTVEPGSTKPEVTGLRGIMQGEDAIIRCPLGGRVVAISIKPGDSLNSGDEICVLETMKMEQNVLSSHQGTVKEIFIKPGENVQTGTALIKLTD